MLTLTQLLAESHDRGDDPKRAVHRLIGLMMEAKVSSLYYRNTPEETVDALNQLRELIDDCLDEIG